MIRKSILAVTYAAALALAFASASHGFGADAPGNPGYDAPASCCKKAGSKGADAETTSKTCVKRPDCEPGCETSAARPAKKSGESQTAKARAKA